MGKLIIRLLCVCLLVNFCKTQRQISLNGRPTAQGPTIGSYLANLAIDGSFDTFAASSSAHVPDNMAWWRVDMGSTYTVHSVRIANGNYNLGGTSFQLGLFDIYVVTEGDIYLLCNRYTSTPIPANSNQLFPCTSGFNVGRYIYIKKLPDGKDILVLAEVQVFLTTPANVVAATTSTPFRNVGQPGPQIPLSGLYSFQIGTMGTFFSSLAMDGNPSTYSVACSNCDVNNLGGSPGWWEIDLVENVTVTGVELMSSSDPNYSNTLQEIVVGVSSQPMISVFDQFKCAEYDGRGVNINTNQKILLTCNQPMKGRYLIVARKPTAQTRLGTISIAEIRIFVYDPNWKLNTVVNTVNSNNVGGYGSGSKISGGPVMQSADYDKDHLAGLAVDGNLETYSIAVPNVNGAAAWWMVDLNDMYSITGLTITSSTDFTNAQYLQNFVVLVSQSSYTDDPTFQLVRVCYSNLTNGVVPTKTLVAYKCNNPLTGRYVIIRRGIPGPMSLAEVVIYANSA